VGADTPNSCAAGRKARERELLGSETRVYNSDRYVVDVTGQSENWLTLGQVRSTNLRRHTGAYDEVDKTVARQWRLCVGGVHTTGGA
jgi:hypothetical protein